MPSAGRRGSSLPARTLAERFGCAWTTSLDQLASSDVDAVTIATPDHLHAEPTLAMLRAGKHVLVEKPLATSVSEALAMTEAAEASGLKLMVDFHARWHPLFMSAKGYVERGELGALVMAYARLSDTIHVPTEMLNWSGHSGPEWFLFPHTMLNFYPWGLSLNVVVPLAVDRTRIIYRTWVSDPSRRGKGAGGALDRVELEDEAIVQQVQKGVRSRLYDRGRYSPSRETGVHHFHRLLAGMLD